MDKSKIVEFLNQLNTEDGFHKPKIWEEKFDKITNELCTDFHSISESLESITKHHFSLDYSKQEFIEWKIICLFFYLMKQLKSVLTKDVILSVQETRKVKRCLNFITRIGIGIKLLPNLPLFIKSQSTKTKNETDTFWDYNIMKCTTLGLCELLKVPSMRLLVLPECLGVILVSVYQIAFCPLMKPGNKKFSMPESTYKILLQEKLKFTELMDYLSSSIHPKIFCEHNMIIFRETSPKWFKQQVSRNLTRIFRSPNGVETVAISLISDCQYDSTKTWKALDVLARLIVSCKASPDFKTNTCQQVVKLLDKAEEDALLYERIFTYCTKSIHQTDPELSKEEFVSAILTHLKSFTSGLKVFQDGEEVTQKTEQTIRLIHSVFLENADNPALPLSILKPVIGVLFRLCALTANSTFKTTHSSVKAVLTSYLLQLPEEFTPVIDSFLFGIQTDSVTAFRNDIVLEINGAKMVVRSPEHPVRYSSLESSESVLELMKPKSKLLVKFFGYLLNTLRNKTQYFNKANEELLELESESVLSGSLERNIAVYKLLSDMAEAKSIQKQLTDEPGDLVKYIGDVLKAALKEGTHRGGDIDSQDFQSFFTVIMIVQSLVDNSPAKSLKLFTSLKPDLMTISQETSNVELKNVCWRIIKASRGNSGGGHRTTPKTNVDKAIEDICDPLLPTRGHGLLTLTKLLEKKDKATLDRKQYILNVLQQNLKNEDSFICLTAIGGLAALTDVFPDTVLNILCEEYSDPCRKGFEGEHEVRVKLGECLVRVTRQLGEMAPKYKPLLLNTFLVGVKDDDDLMRASSLSNLGEICKTLGFKLGTIVTEVLACVHAVIATDKSPQARRAAVTVIRQLFVGLETEMLAFLKEDILPIYRTLKAVYDGDEDDVMRLQAQLALEELNENMTNFVFAKPTLHAEKKIVMLN